MKKRLKDNIATIVLIITIICCTISINNKIEKTVYDNTNYLESQLVSDLPSIDLVHSIRRDVSLIKSHLLDK